MTASELAFLALGLCLGVAVGSALLLVVGRGTGRRDVRVTVTREAVPSRSKTLSQDAFMPPSTGPAPGGPGDRRTADRTGDGASDGGDGATRRAPVGIPIEVPVSPPVAAPAPAAAAVADRTIVPSRPAVAVEIQPEPARELEGIRRRVVHGTPIERMLRGEHLALIEVVDEVAGTGTGRRDWEVLLGGLVDGMAAVAIRESVIDFPMGTPFWDQFTVEQCRRIAGSLASMGYRYDGADGWADSRVPVYRDVTRALADVGVEPRRLRSWPNQAEIAFLFVGARPAPEELLAAAGPEYSAPSMQTLLGEHAAGLEDLWIAWDAVRPVLFREELVREPSSAL
ncbi:MAG TPA: hypothetical protein VJ850_06030 [Candidatus Limnocylindrales bacterium]|nr:hypothetical protein [Candidatus Limnocylindrales bacterium]